MSSLIALASSQFGIIVERVHVGRDIGQCQLIAKLNIYKINLEREREREREREVTYISGSAAIRLIGKDSIQSSSGAVVVVDGVMHFHLGSESRAEEGIQDRHVHGNVGIGISSASEKGSFVLIGTCSKVVSMFFPFLVKQ